MTHPEFNKRFFKPSAIMTDPEFDPSTITALQRAKEVMIVDATKQPDTFQARVDLWLEACFGFTIARDKRERQHRFIEEALELVQACGMSALTAHRLVDYVFNRPIGELYQEVGGVTVTLNALCSAYDIKVTEAQEVELARIWTKVEKIREKQLHKPKFSPLAEGSMIGSLFSSIKHLIPSRGESFKLRTMESILKSIQREIQTNSPPHSRLDAIDVLVKLGLEELDK